MAAMEVGRVGLGVRMDDRRLPSAMPPDSQSWKGREREFERGRKNGQGGRIGMEGGRKLLHDLVGATGRPGPLPFPRRGAAESKPRGGVTELPFRHSEGRVGRSVAVKTPLHGRSGPGRRCEPRPTPRVAVHAGPAARGVCIRSLRLCWVDTAESRRERRGEREGGEERRERERERERRERQREERESRREREERERESHSLAGLTQQS